MKVTFRRGRESGNPSLMGSLTVEASLVMAVLLFLIAALLRGAFEIHSQTVGNLILQEALETADRREDGGPALKELESRAQGRLRLYFWCQNGSIGLKEEKRRLTGTAGGSLSSSISVKKFNPEKFLRTVRAFEK